MDYHVLKLATEYLMDMKDKFPDTFLSVNISPINLNFELIDYIRELLDRSKIDPKNLVLEILESANLNMNVDSITVIEELSKLGLRISIDDFGTGYSSLETISKLPIDFLKVDKSYFVNIDEHSFEQILLESLLQIGNKVGFYLIAEGIETKKQLKHIQKLKYHYCQGFLYYEAMKYEEAIQILIKVNEIK